MKIQGELRSLKVKFSNAFFIMDDLKLQFDRYDAVSRIKLHFRTNNMDLEVRTSTWKNVRKILWSFWTTISIFLILNLMNRKTMQ